MPKPPDFKECCDAMKGRNVDEKHAMVGPAGIILDRRCGPGAVWAEIYDKRLCVNCGKRPGTHAWSDLLIVSQGGVQRRCEICLYSAHAKRELRCIRVLPSLLWKLAAAYVRKR